MVYSSEKNIHLFENNVAGLGDQENDKECQETVYSTEEEERVADYNVNES